MNIVTIFLVFFKFLVRGLVQKIIFLTKVIEVADLSLSIGSFLISFDRSQRDLIIIQFTPDI